jgi:cofilin
MKKMIPDESIIEDFNNLKIKKLQRCLVLAINENKLQVTHKGDQEFSFKNLTDNSILPTNEPRFVIYDFDYETEEVPPRKTSKLIFIFWCPVQCAAKLKLVYSSSVSETVCTLGGIRAQFEFGSYSDLDYESVRKELLE